MEFVYRPLEDRVIVQPDEPERETASGLIIPDAAQSRPEEGTIVAVGPGRFDHGARVPLDLNVGDRVVFSRYGGTEVKIGDVEFLIFRAADIYAVKTDGGKGGTP